MISALYWRLIVMSVSVSWAITTPARADDVLRVKCETSGTEIVCSLPVKELTDLIQSNNAGWTAAELAVRRAAELELELKQRPPKCATLEVEPAKPESRKIAPLLRKDRDL
jgi:hypothetical protein